MSNNRQASRHACSLPARVRARGSVYTGQVVDISSGGMCVSTARRADVWAGDQVDVFGPAFGMMSGTVRWRAFDRLGIQFRDCTDTMAKLDALRKQYFLPV